jgi:hypothetical protein
MPSPVMQTSEDGVSSGMGLLLAPARRRNLLVGSQNGEHGFASQKFCSCPSAPSPSTPFFRPPCRRAMAVVRHGPEIVYPSIASVLARAGLLMQPPRTPVSRSVENRRYYPYARARTALQTREEAEEGEDVDVFLVANRASSKLVHHSRAGRSIPRTPGAKRPWMCRLRIGYERLLVDGFNGSALTKVNRMTWKVMRRTQVRSWRRSSVLSHHGGRGRGRTAPC